MKLILHPGHGKCGSSSIQQWIGGNISNLLSEGISVPGRSLELLRKPSDFNVSSFYLKDIILSNEQERFEQTLNKFINDAEKISQTVLWSDEFLSDPRVISGPFSIHKILKERFEEVQLIYFIRRQDDFVMSGWQQWRHKKGLSLEEECLACIKSNTPDYHRNINHFESIYSQQSIKVRPFDKKYFLNQDLIQEFCSSVDLQFKNYQQIQDRTNVSLNPYICDILSYAPEGLYKGNLDDNAVKKWLEQMVTSDALVHSHKEFMSQELRDLVMDHFNEENVQIHQHYLADFKFSDVFASKRVNKERDDLMGIKTTIAIQFEILYKLHKIIIEQNKNNSCLKAGLSNSIYRRLKRLFKIK